MINTLAIIIPAYNEEKSISELISSLPKKINGIDSIISIVVDDGSTDKTYLKSKNHATHTARHAINLGVGAATITGYEIAKKLKANYFVTLDGDGQHNPQDIKRIIKPLLSNECDIVFGVRKKNKHTMPLVKKFGNYLMSLATFIVFNKWVSDSQTGMRAMNEKTIKKIKLNSSGYEICSEIIGEVQRTKLKMCEIPIETIYNDYSKNKGQHILNAVNIFTKILFIRLGHLK